MKHKTFDVVVIGGGAAGLTASKLARGLGKSVLLVEKEDRLGGECTWTGCVPSKTLIYQASLAHAVTRLSSFGMRLTDAALSTEGLFEQITKTVCAVSKTHTPAQIEALGIQVLFGTPRFSSERTLMVDDQCITFTRCIIATGSSPRIPPIAGIDQVAYLTNQNLFALQQVPVSLCIIGGGPIGIEMAGAFLRLGCSVSIIEQSIRILPHEEPDASDFVCTELQQAGAIIHCNATAQSVETVAQGVRITAINRAGTVQTVVAHSLLIATGRVPNIATLKLSAAGIVMRDGKLEVDTYLRTSNTAVFACGDVVGPYLFSHMAWYQATIAARNACVPLFKKRYTKTVVPIWTLFTDPECSRLGLTIAQARKMYGESFRTYRFTIEQLDRAVIEQRKGFGIIITDHSWNIVGATIVAPRSGALISELALAQQYAIPLYKIADVIHPYPTYAEALWHVAKRAYVDWLNSRWYIRLARLFFGLKRQS